MTDDEKQKGLTSRIAYSQGTLEINPQILARVQSVVESAHRDLADEQKKLDALQQEFDASAEQIEKPAAKPDH